MQSPLLQVKNLHISFELSERKIEAVQGIHFHINKGEIVGIVGESGSGKSVTALSIMQLLTKTAKVTGEILHFNQQSNTNLLDFTPKQIQTYRGKVISMIFQEPMSSLNPVFRCGDQVIEAIQVHQNIHRDAAKQLVLAWFEKAKLDDPERIFNAYPHQLSGGQKQRVMIAMAMCCEPDLLLADEPTTALDVSVQKAILELIKELQAEQQMSVLFISHDLGVIAELADRVLVMKNGEIVESGRVEELFATPQHPYTKGLLACRPPIDKKLYRLPTISDFEEGEKIATSIENTSSKISKPLLRVEELCTYFPKEKNVFGQAKSYIKAVDKVSFEVQEGETLALVGESGSGKTTLGRSVLRLIEPQSGSIYFDGHAVMDLNNLALLKLRREMQIIFQDPYSALNPRKPVGYAITEPMNVHGIANSKEKAIELLETVGMEADHFNRYPHEFSGGQRQRICIARALSLNPKFMVCDECVSALDVSVQAQVLNLLKDLQEKFGLSYLFITHDLSVVRFMGDRVLVMKSGEIVESGYPEQIFENPQQDYTKALLAAVPKGL